MQCTAPTVVMTYAITDGYFDVYIIYNRYEARLAHEESLGIELMAQHALMKKNLQVS